MLPVSVPLRTYTNNSAIFRARDLKFSPKFLTKYFKNEFEKKIQKIFFKKKIQTKKIKKKF